jgi:hypothetical protein
MTGQESAHMSVELTELTNQISLNGKEPEPAPAPPQPKEVPQPVVHKSPSLVGSLNISLLCFIFFLNNYKS